MNNFFRALIAGYGAKKLGGGCLGTIVVFILIWVALGQCSFTSREVPPPQTYPAKHQVMCQYKEPAPTASKLAKNPTRLSSLTLPLISLAERSGLHHR